MFANKYKDATDETLLDEKDNINWQELLKIRKVDEFVLGQVNNVKWEDIAINQGISLKLFERITGIVLFWLGEAGQENGVEIYKINGFSFLKSDKELLSAHRYSLLEINWYLFAEKCFFKNDLMLNSFLFFIKNDTIFKKGDLNFKKLYLCLKNNNTIKDENKEKIKNFFINLDKDIEQNNAIYEVRKNPFADNYGNENTKKRFEDNTNIMDNERGESFFCDENTSSS